MIYEKRNIKKFLWCVPVIWGIYFVISYGVNVIHSDEFEIVKLLIQIKKGAFSFGELFALHNEHRFFFPRVIILIVALLTDYNTKVIMFVNVAVVTLTYFIYLRYLLYIDCKHEKELLIRGIMIGFVCFNVVQWQNFLWGFQIAWFLIVLCTAYSFWCFERYLKTNQCKLLVLSLLSAGVSSFCSMQGLFVWIVLLISLVICKINHSTIPKHLWVYMLGSIVVCVCLYFHDFTTSGNDKYYFHGQIGVAAQTFLQMLGYPISLEKDISIIAGGILFIISIIIMFYNIFDRERFVENLFPCMLVIYGYITVAATVVGRVGMTTESGIQSRYATNTLTIYVGLFLLTRMIMKKTIFLYLSRIIISLLLFIICVQNITRKDDFLEARQNRLENQAIMYNYDDVPLKKITRLYPFKDYYSAYTLLGEIKQYHLNVFSDKVSKKIYKVENVGASVYTNRVYLGNIDSGELDEKSVNIIDGFLCISNQWGIDPKRHQTLEGVLVKIGDDVWQANYGLYRKDVADAYHTSDVTYCGWEFMISTEEIGQAGRIPLSVILLTKDGGYYKINDFFINLNSIDTYLEEKPSLYIDKNAGIISTDILKVLKNKGMMGNSISIPESLMYRNGELRAKILLEELSEYEERNLYLCFGGALYPYTKKEENLFLWKVGEEINEEMCTIIMMGGNGRYYYESKAFYVREDGRILSYADFYDRYIEKKLCNEIYSDSFLENKNYRGKQGIVGFDLKSVKIENNNLLVVKDGWAFSKEENMLISDLFIHLGENLYRCNVGKERWDVANEFEDYAEIYSGFSSYIELPNVDWDKLYISLISYSKDSNEYWETNPFSVKDLFLQGK